MTPYYINSSQTQVEDQTRDWTDGTFLHTGSIFRSSVVSPMGEITRVLFNLVLIMIFDCEFPKRFPGIAFVRFLHEVYIFTRSNDEVIFDEKVGYALLEELGLQGKIESTGQYDDPLYCYYNKIIYVDIYDCDVQVCDPADYY